MLLDLSGVEAVAGEGFDNLLFLVGEVGQQRVGKDVDRILQFAEVFGSSGVVSPSRDVA